MGGAECGVRPNDTTAHELARIVYNMMRFGVAYMKKDEETYPEQVRERLEKQLKRRAKELGFEVVKKADADAVPAAPLSV
jgi:ribulose 1,5-bisphosphate carboxylase large subunit-like protein